MNRIEVEIGTTFWSLAEKYTKEAEQNTTESKIIQNPRTQKGEETW